MGNPISSKQVIAIDGASTTNAATATGMIDTLGYSYASIDIKTSTSNDTTNNPSVLKLTEGDTTVITSASAVSGFTGDTDFDIPASVTSGSWGCKFNVDLRGRKRYLFVSVSPVTTQTVDAVANLFRGEDAPNDATKAGVKALVEG